MALRGLATAVTILLVLAILAALLGVGAFTNRVSVVDDFFNGAGSPSDVDDADAAAAGTGLFFFLLWVATGVVFIIWQFRHAKNAELLGGRVSLGPGWAIGGWFIPIAHYVLPASQLWQSARNSDPDAAGRPGGGRAPGIIIAWALAYAAGAILLTVGAVSHPDEEDIFSGGSSYFEDFQQADRLTAMGFGLLAVAAVLAILMVRTLTANQDQAVRRRVGAA